MGTGRPDNFLRCCRLAALAIVAFMPARSLARPGDVGGPWKFDVVHLKNGMTVQGLLIKENAGHVVLLPIRQNPGEPTVIVQEASYLASEVERIEKLDPIAHEALSARVLALRSRDDEKRTSQLKLTKVPWRETGTTALQYSREQFVLISDADEKTVRRVAGRLQDIYAAFDRFLPPKVTGAKPTTIYLYKSLASYHDYLEKQGRNILNPAFYDPQRDQILWGSDLVRLESEREARRQECQEMLQRLAAQDAQWRKIYHGHVPIELTDKSASDRRKIESMKDENDRKFRRAEQDLYRVLYHEAFHAYLSNYVYPPAQTEVPRWLNEGLAQIFENAIIEVGALRVCHVGPSRIYRVKSALQHQELVPLADLLRSGFLQFLVVHSGSERSSNEYYLASWALSFYLTFELKKVGTPEMDQYVRSLKNPGTDPIVAFEHFVDRPLDEFEKEFHDYLRHLGSDGKRN